MRRVGRIDDRDHRVGARLSPARRPLDHLERDLLVGGGRREAVGARQVDHRDAGARPASLVVPTLRSTVTPA